jgi:hypothetical protein
MGTDLKEPPSTAAAVASQPQPQRKSSSKRRNSGTDLRKQLTPCGHLKDHGWPLHEHMYTCILCRIACYVDNDDPSRQSMRDALRVVDAAWATCSLRSEPTFLKEYGFDTVATVANQFLVVPLQAALTSCQAENFLSVEEEDLRPIDYAMIWQHYLTHHIPTLAVPAQDSDQRAYLKFASDNPNPFLRRK